MNIYAFILSFYRSIMYLYIFHYSTSNAYVLFQLLFENEGRLFHCGCRNKSLGPFASQLVVKLIYRRLCVKIYLKLNFKSTAKLVIENRNDRRLRKCICRIIDIKPSHKHCIIMHQENLHFSSFYSTTCSHSPLLC